LHLYSSHDLLTVNEIFCREDYPARGHELTIVDFGSNIGISAAWFLAQTDGAYLYLYEPLPLNVERLERNLRSFQGRYEVHQKAVGPTFGEVIFGWEATGRYGGVGRDTGNYMTVTCLSAAEVLSSILESHDQIDILKIDIETMEEAIIASIPSKTFDRIDVIFVEYHFARNPIPTTHTMTQNGSIATFRAIRRGI